MPIKVKVLGDFEKTEKYFNTALHSTDIQKIEKIAERSVKKFADATPKESNLTADSWGYEIIQNGKGFSLIFANSNVKNGVNIALIIDSGHATSDGKWIRGKKYLDKTTEEVYNDILNETWEELKNL